MIKLEKSKIVLIFVALTVVAAGCTDTENDIDSSATAVEVVGFNASPGTVYDNQRATLQLTLRNAGEAEATEVEAEIFDLTMGAPENRGWEVQDDGDFEFGSLNPADPDAGMEAMEYHEVKTMTPPNLGDNENIPYPVAARIMFGYENSASTEIQIMSERRFRETGVGFSRPTTQNSDGPIHMEVQTRTPIEYRGEDVTHDLRVVVRNEGGGTPYLGDEYYEDDDKVKLGVSATEDINLEPMDGDETVELIGGARGFQTYEISDVDFDPQDDTQTTVPLTITASYNYYKEEHTSVTVRGTGTQPTHDDSEGGSEGDDLEYRYVASQGDWDETVALIDGYSSDDYGDEEAEDAVCQELKGSSPAFNPECEER